MVKNNTRIPILVKNHDKIDINTLDKELLNGIDIKHFELQEMKEGYEFKYGQKCGVKGTWCNVVAICLHNNLIIIEIEKDGVIIEKTVRFFLNLVIKDEFK